MCVCLETSLFGKLHCLNSNTTTTEHAPSLSTAYDHQPWVQQSHFNPSDLRSDSIS